MNSKELEKLFQFPSGITKLLHTEIRRKRKSSPKRKSPRSDKEVSGHKRIVHSEEFNNIHSALGPYVKLRETEKPLSFRKSLKFAYKEDFDTIESYYNDCTSICKQRYINLQSSPEKDFGLSKVECLSILLYTAEFIPEHLNLYNCLNKDISSDQRDQTLLKWRFYLYYLFNALKKIPIWKSNQELYRGVNEDVVKKYPQKYVKGNQIIWFSFTSTTSDISIVKNELQKNGEEKDVTIFHITKSLSGRNIQPFSTNNRLEVVFPPGSRFNIKSIQGGNIKIIQLYQISSLENILNE